MNGISEHELVKAVLRGNPRSESVLYERFSVPMFRVCLRYAKDRHEAEDMLQEGFLRIYTDLNQFRFEGSLEGWMRKVMIRTALRLLRQRQSFDQLEALDTGLIIDEPPELEPLKTGEAARIAALMQQLPPGYRSVLNLYAIEGYTHDEIAELLEISVGTSKSQLFKARNMLKTLLEKSLSTNI
jgi:RNA polymerase sigma factor (sigma-70 family)